MTMEIRTEGANERQQHNEVHEPDWVGNLLTYPLHKEAYSSIHKGLTHTQYEWLYSKHQHLISRLHSPRKVHNLSYLVDDFHYFTECFKVNVIGVDSVILVPLGLDL